MLSLLGVFFFLITLIVYAGICLVRVSMNVVRLLFVYLFNKFGLHVMFLFVSHFTLIHMCGNVF